MEDKLAALPFMLLGVSQIIIFFILDFQIDRIKRKMEKEEAWKEKLRAHDTISRQAAIDAIVAWTVEDRPDIEMPTDLVGRINAQPDCSDCIKHGGDWDCDHVHCHKGESAQPDNDMIHLQKEQAYLQGWEEGRKALRKEIWEDGRDRLD